jgi:RNA polymerase sigma factor (sigma-70 family)
VVNRSRLDITGSRVRLRLASDERLVTLVRRDVAAAFEALYDRHSRELLAFCVYMLGSSQDAEDALQATYTSAYRALVSSSRPVALRPWLFAIARNECLTVLRRRRPVAELNGEVAVWGDPVKHSELREEMLEMLDGLRRLPERQRTALVLAEVNDLSQSEIGAVLGVRAAQVKAYIYQARANLSSERKAREADCREIREELSSARGAALLRGRLRRHVRACAGCREYVDSVAHQRRQFGALTPLLPALALKYRVIEQALGLVASDPETYAGGAVVGGSAAAAAAVEIAGGGAKAVAVKVAVTVAALGASAGVGVSMLDVPEAHRQGHGAAAGASTTAASLRRAVADADGSTVAEGGSVAGKGGGKPATGGSSRSGWGRHAAGHPLRPGRGGRAPSPTPGSEPGDSRGAGREAGEAVHVRGLSNSKSTPGENAERRQEARNERKREHEQERMQRREASGRGGESPGSGEERHLGRKEHPGGGSKGQKTEEELLLKHEAGKQRREERKLRREEGAGQEEEQPEASSP